MELEKEKSYKADEVAKIIDEATRYIGVIEMKDGQIAIMCKGFFDLTGEIGFLEVAKQNLVESTKKKEPTAGITR